VGDINFLGGNLISSLESGFIAEHTSPPLFCGSRVRAAQRLRGVERGRGRCHRMMSGGGARAAPGAGRGERRGAACHRTTAGGGAAGAATNRAGVEAGHGGCHSLMAGAVPPAR